MIANMKIVLSFICVKRYGGPSPVENVVNEKLDSKRHQEAQNLFRTAYTCVKEYMPFTKYEALCELQELNGIVLWDNYLSRKACARFVQSITEDIKGDLRSSIKNSRFVSILSDGSTDKGIIEEEIVYVRFVEDGKPHTKLVSVESPNSVDAAGIMTAIQDSIATLKLDEDETGIISRILQEIDKYQFRWR